jgi:hypothetical protein
VDGSPATRGFEIGIAGGGWTAMRSVAIIEMMAKVGIKLANGKFYPILDE